MNNEFLITNLTTKMDMDYSYNPPSIENPFNPIMREQIIHKAFEITVRPLGDVNEVGRKLINILNAGRKIIINDAAYNDFVEPFKHEFIEFMMEKYPEKIIANPKDWDRLLGMQ